MTNSYKVENLDCLGRYLGNDFPSKLDVDSFKNRIDELSVALSNARSDFRNRCAIQSGVGSAELVAFSKETAVVSAAVRELEKMTAWYEEVCAPENKSKTRQTDGTSFRDRYAKSRADSKNAGFDRS